MPCQFAPKTAKEYVGNSEQLDEVRECINKNLPVLLVGPCGVGKTTALQLIAAENKMRIIEVNSSDERNKDKLNEFLVRVQMGSFVKLLYVFEEVDGASKTSGKLFKEIIEKSRYPMAFTCNNQYMVPEEITRRCEVVKFRKPTLAQVTSRAKQVAKAENVKNPNLNAISHDIRNSLIAAVYDTEAYTSYNDFERVDKLFTQHALNETDKDFFIWLIDNADKFYTGIDLYKVYELIALADRYHNDEFLTLMPTGRGKGNTEAPYFYRRLKAQRQKE